eukprot:6049076-Alexandrium_andersonii.AAC.1
MLHTESSRKFQSSSLRSRAGEFGPQLCGKCAHTKVQGSTALMVRELTPFCVLKSPTAERQ